MPTLDDAFDWFRARRAVSACAPATEPDFRDLLGAYLGRSLAPAAVRATLAALDERGLSDPENLADADLAELAGIQSVSSPRTLKPLQTLARWVVERGGLAAMVDRPTADLRDELRSQRGLGAAGVDAILLDGLNRPVFPIGQPTYRVLVRHGWLDADAGYDEASEALRRFAPDEPEALRALASQLEEIGTRFCRVSGPKCATCPLQPLLPEGGPISPDVE